MKNMKDNNKQINETVQLLKQELGPNLLSVVLYGSAAENGLKRHSDIDFLIIINSELSFQNRVNLVPGLMNISVPIGSEHKGRYIELTAVTGNDLLNLEYPPVEEIQYGEWLREEFLLGNLPERTQNPDLAILLKQALQNHQMIYGESLSRFITEIPDEHIQNAIKDLLSEIWLEDAGDERNTILTLCRMWLTAETGGIKSKEAAADWAMDRLEKYTWFIQVARDEYMGDIEVDWSKEDIESLVIMLKNKVSAFLHKQK